MFHKLPLGLRLDQSTCRVEGFNPVILEIERDREREKGREKGREKESERGHQATFYTKEEES